jgi:acetoacetyl-CoA synthetase
LSNELLWQPSESAIANSALTSLTTAAVAKTGLNLDSYADLHKWSISQPGDFWSLVWDHLEIIGDKGSVNYSPGKNFIDAKFFPESSLNIAENILAQGKADEVAIVAIDEAGNRSEITWAQLRTQSAAVAAALTDLGVVSGDRVVAWTPNYAEVIIYALGALSIGAVVSTSSPDFAPNAVLDRFGQIEPKVLLAAQSYSYNGKSFDCIERLTEITASLPTLVKTVLITDQTNEFTSFDNWIKPYLGTEAKFLRLPFNHPGFVLFSSGTTGKPKCIIHSAAGVYLKAVAEHRYQFDTTPGDKVFFYTTCGWMMWNWLATGLGAGATIVLFDGQPMYPNPERLFDIAQDEKLDFFGVSAKFIDSAAKADLKPIQSHDLSNLKVIASTGSVLAPESFDYVYREVKKDVHLASMSGGTDICGCFAAGIATQGVYRGELQGPVLGMATDVYDVQGKSAASDEKGELVCTVPFPSKPNGFWGDEDNAKYRSAYYEGFAGVWTHGDFAAKTKSGGFVIYGRSDATLNSKGVRIGTAEIYRVVETFAQVQEAMAVSQDFEGDTRVVLFITLKGDAELTPEFEKEIKTALRVQASPRHVPDLVVVAPELPRTKSNKLVELAVGDVINGREVRNRDALANPLALDWFKQFAL